MLLGHTSQTVRARLPLQGDVVQYLEVHREAHLVAPGPVLLDQRRAGIVDVEAAAGVAVGQAAAREVEAGRELDAVASVAAGLALVAVILGVIVWTGQ